MDRSNMILYLVGVFSCFFISNVAALDAEGIIGGDYADDAQFKYQVSLQIGGSSFCGGAIIADNYVLTAAHCVVENETPGAPIRDIPIKVVAGTIDLNTNKGKPVEAAVEKVYVHAGYEPPETHNDIAVLKLIKGLGIDRNSYLGKINLPTKQNTYVGKSATISGYGLQSMDTRVNPLTGDIMELGGDTDNKLKYATVKIIANSKCAQLSRPQNISPKQICGSVVQRGREHEGICSGDSGGPLVYGDVIIGVVSTSPPGCDEHMKPAVYTRVSSFAPFVDDIMNGKPRSDARVLTIGSSFYEPPQKPNRPKWPFGFNDYEDDFLGPFGDLFGKK